MTALDSHFTSNASSSLHAYFDTGAATYETRAGGATRAIAEAIVPYLEPLLNGEFTPAPKPSVHAHIHDNASGPGTTCAAILVAHPGAHVSCTDNAPGMIALVNSYIGSRMGWAGHVEAAVMDSCALDFADDTFDASVTNFGIFMFGSPEQGAREIYRTLKTSGKAVVTSWRFVGWLPILRAVQAMMMPGKKGFESGLLDKWRRKDMLVGCLCDGGFSREDIVVKEVETAIWGEESRFEESRLEEWMRNFAVTMGLLAWESMTEGEKYLLEGGLRALREAGNDEFFIRGNKEGTFGVRMVALIGLAKR